MGVCTPICPVRNVGGMLVPPHRPSIEICIHVIDETTLIEAIDKEELIL